MATMLAVNLADTPMVRAALKVEKILKRDTKAYRRVHHEGWTMKRAAKEAGVQPRQLRNRFAILKAMWDQRRAREDDES